MNRLTRKEFEQRRHTSRVNALVGRITPPADRAIIVGINEHGMTYVQARGLVANLTDPLAPGPRSWQGGGKAYISEHAVDNEIVSCCLGLLIAFEEHETREAFLFDGARIYGPHLRLEALQDIARETEVRA